MNGSSRFIPLIFFILYLSACDLAVPFSDSPQNTAQGEDHHGIMATEGWMVALDYPKRMRRGDISNVRMTITSLSGGPQLPQTFLDSVLPGYRLIAEAEFVMPRMAVAPSGVSAQPVDGREEIVFTWFLRADADGYYSGNIWLNLERIPLVTGGMNDEYFLTAIPVDIQASSLAGISGNIARNLGILGVMISILIWMTIMTERLTRSAKVRS